MLDNIDTTSEPKDEATVERTLHNFVSTLFRSKPNVAQVRSKPPELLISIDLYSA